MFDAGNMKAAKEAYAKCNDTPWELATPQVQMSWIEYAKGNPEPKKEEKLKFNSSTVSDGKVIVGLNLYVKMVDTLMLSLPQEELDKMADKMRERKCPVFMKPMVCAFQAVLSLEDPEQKFTFWQEHVAEPVQ